MNINYLATVTLRIAMTLCSIGHDLGEYYITYELHHSQSHRVNEPLQPQSAVQCFVQTAYFMALDYLPQ